MNSSPNYGDRCWAFGQRLGAAAARGVSEGVFSNSLFAPLFHEDPRYYIMGPGHSFFKRLVYAGTRSIITRTDSGKTHPTSHSSPATRQDPPSPSPTIRALTLPSERSLNLRRLSRWLRAGFCCR